MSPNESAGQASRRSMAYRARWVVPVDARPVENGVLVVADGRIAAVHQRWSQPVVDLGDVVLLPGLVNTHTHLEFSDLARPIEARNGFAQWVKDVIAVRQSRTDDVQRSIRLGLRESLAAGVTTVGEIATQGWPLATDAGPSLPDVVVFQELLGLTPQRIEEQLRLAESLAPEIQLSPHAPYSVHPRLWDGCVEQARQQGRMLCVHLAETEDERQLLETGSGPLRDFLVERGLWSDEMVDPGRWKHWLEQLVELPRALVVHGNYLGQAELAHLARHPHVTLVYCPRTHAAFGHPRHPWRELVEMGGSVALGTDGRSSNPDLSFWKELQFLAEQTPNVPHASLLRLATWNGARALGRLSTCGSLTPGKVANVVAVSLSDVERYDPAFHLLNHDSSVVGTMLHGTWVTGEFVHLAGSSRS